MISLNINWNDIIIESYKLIFGGLITYFVIVLAGNKIQARFQEGLEKKRRTIQERRENGKELGYEIKSASNKLLEIIRRPQLILAEFKDLARLLKNHQLAKEQIIDPEVLDLFDQYKDTYSDIKAIELAYRRMNYLDILSISKNFIKFNAKHYLLLDDELSGILKEFEDLLSELEKFYLHDIEEILTLLDEEVKTKLLNIESESLYKCLRIQNKYKKAFLNIYG
jgi:hypothetical protein